MGPTVPGWGRWRGDWAKEGGGEGAALERAAAREWAQFRENRGTAPARAPISPYLLAHPKTAYPQCCDRIRLPVWKAALDG
jgi:hypothetical protein